MSVGFCQIGRPTILFVSAVCLDVLCRDELVTGLQWFILCSARLCKSAVSVPGVLVVQVCFLSLQQ